MTQPSWALDRALGVRLGVQTGAGVLGSAQQARGHDTDKRGRTAGADKSAAAGWSAGRAGSSSARAQGAAGALACAAGGAQARGARQAGAGRAAWALGAQPGRAGWSWVVHSVHSSYFRSVLTRYCS